MNTGKTKRIPIKPIQKRSVAEQIIYQLQSLIESGIIEPGSRLPSERELAEMLDVSRPSLREALKALSLLGIVENRPGSGTYLTTSENKWPKEPFSILFSINKSALFDIFEARKGLEGMVASLAARRSTEDDLEHMQEALSGMEKALDQHAQYNKFEREFHLAIIEAARNNVISQLMDKLYRLLEETRLRVSENGSTPPANRDEDFRNHKMIYKYIEAGDEHSASVAMVSHLLQFERLLKSERDALD